MREHEEVLTPPQAVRRTIVLSLAAAALNACRRNAPPDEPDIHFSRIPKADAQSSDQNDIIEGTVSGARPGQKLVLYAKSGRWWVQPLEAEPFTTIGSNRHWTNATHLGTDYAALLVEPNYVPEASMEELPSTGGEIAAVRSVAGGAKSPSPILSFSGYEWRLRTAPSSRGGAMNQYDPANATVDSSGALHLRISKSGENWICAEVSLTRSLGYGSHEFSIRNVAQLDPAIVFSIFTWDYAGGPQNNNREMDIEMSRWGDPDNKNGQYVIQPFHVAMNVSRFSLPAGLVRHTVEWRPGRIFCRSRDARGAVIAQHEFTSGIPAPGLESFRMIVYPYSYGQTRLKDPSEVVIEKFEYLP